jgi:hypothetical protein
MVCPPTHVITAGIHSLTPNGAGRDHRRFKFSSWHGELLLSLHFTNMDLGADLGGEDPSGTASTQSMMGYTMDASPLA